MSMFSNLTIVLDILASSERQDRQIKEMNGMEGVKVSLLADDMIFYKREPLESSRKFLVLINSSSKW